MEDTAQPLAAANDPVAEAANAFKASLGQIEQPPEPKRRDENGRFAGEAPTDDGEDEELEPEAQEAEGEEQEPETDDDEGPDQEDDQPAVEMPRSWPSDKAELWSTLPPETQGFIAEREGQRDSAVNAKFQEAANVRKQYELQAHEAQRTRDTFAALAEAIVTDLQVSPPSEAMLDERSPHYNPALYRAKLAEYKQLSDYRQELSQRLETAKQQRQADEERAMQEYINEVNSKTREALVRDVPEIADQQRAPAKIKELMDYAMSIGVPAEQFNTPFTALEWHVLHKAKSYDEMMSAQAKMGKQPVKAQPGIRPGVATSRSAAKASRVARDMKRVSQEGSVEAGAAVWKHFL